MSPKPLAKNIIVIYIDALSRAHAHRKINETLKWFEEGLLNSVILFLFWLILLRNKIGHLLNFLDIIQAHHSLFLMPLVFCLGIIEQTNKKIVLRH